MIDIKTEIENIIKKYPDMWDEQKKDNGTLLFKQGQEIKNIYFCKKGIVRIFYSDEQTGTEKTSGFFSENELAIPIISLVKQLPVMYNIEVIENALLYKISIENWNKIKAQDPIITEILLELMSEILFRFIQYQSDNSIDNSVRYMKLFDKYSYLYRVKDSYIASFLGITASSLSRLKSRLKKNIHHKTL
jgi:CRP-like cAMP-binding protein